MIRWFLLEMFAGIPGNTQNTIKNTIPQTKGDGSEMLVSILNWAYFGAGIVAVVIIVVAGVQYVTGQGEPDKVARAHKTITYSVVGLIVVIMAAAITNFVVGNIG